MLEELNPPVLTREKSTSNYGRWIKMSYVYCLFRHRIIEKSLDITEKNTYLPITTIVVGYTGQTKHLINNPRLSQIVDDSWDDNYLWHISQCVNRVV